MVMQEDGEEQQGYESSQPSVAAAQRLFQELGEGVEAVRDFMGWKANRQLYPYQITIKRPLVAHQDYMVIVKALDVDQPVIAFHGGYGYIEALISMGRRGRNGQLVFRQDDMAPKNLEKWQQEVAYYRDRFG